MMYIAMPYLKVSEGGKVKVYKKGPDGKPEGSALGTHDSEAEADKQMAALHAQMMAEHGKPSQGKPSQGKRDDVLEDGFKVLADGTWRAIYTNNFRDYQDEFIAGKALDDYIARVTTGFRPYPELWFWHLPVPIGQATWMGRVGHFALAAGKFLDNHVGQTFKDALAARGQGYKNSHGFHFPKSLKRDGVFHAVDTFEITALPPNKAANPYTLMEVKKAMAEITVEQRKELDRLLGVDEAAKFIQLAADASKELDKNGLESKGMKDDKDGSEKDKETAGAVDDKARKDLADLTAMFVADKKAMAEQTEKMLESVKALMTPIGASIAASQKEIAEARKENETLKKFLAEQFEMQPRASKNKQTLADKDDPELVAVQKQQADEAMKNTVFAPFFSAIKQLSVGGTNG